MTITQVTTQNVISTLGSGYKVVAVNFRKGQFIDLETMTISAIRSLIESASDGTVKFWKIEYAD